MKTLARFLLMTCLALVASFAWLMGSNSGLRTLVSLATKAGAGQVEISGVQGRLIGPLQIEKLHWHSPTLRIEATRLDLDWSPSALWHKRVHIARLSLTELALHPKSGGTPTVPAQAPTDLRLPLHIALDSLHIARLRIGDTLQIKDLSARLHSSASELKLDRLLAQLGDTQLEATASLATQAPLQVQAQARLSSQLAGHALGVSVLADGPLAALSVQVQATQGVEGQAVLKLAPFDRQVLSRAQIALKNINPQDWQSTAPQARLSLNATLTPNDTDAGYAGQFSLRNTQAGPIDAARIPLVALSGNFSQQGDALSLSRLQADLPGASRSGGRLSGHGRWQNDTLQLNLAVLAVNAAELDSRLRRTALTGTIVASLNARQQSVQTELSDARLLLKADIRHRDAQINIAQLRLQHQHAHLTGKGQLSLKAPQAFHFEGTLNQFDPSLFVTVPSAQINAHLTAQGHLAPQPTLQARFEILPSRLAQQPLSGQGTLDLAWPQLKLADIQLNSGPNQLKLYGAFGQTNDQLQLNIAAPKLALFGLSGPLDGLITLTGTVKQPLIKAQLSSPQLRLPDYSTLKGLRLDAKLGIQPDSPLAIKLDLARFSTATQSNLLESLQLDMSGHNQAHRLRVKTEVDALGSVGLSAEGGLILGADPAWQGRLLEAKLIATEASRTLQLTAPAPLQISRSQWAIGPAQLANPALGWMAKLQASTAGHALQARIQAHGDFSSSLSAELKASMRDAWTLDTQAPWHGQLDAQLDDLKFLGSVLDKGWQTAGALRAQLTLSGSPARQQLHGHITGSQLALRLPEQALNLANGKLAAHLDTTGLHLQELSFDSLLRPPPRTLRLSRQSNIDSLTAKPGRLRIQGNLPLRPDTAPDSGHLTFEFERVGAYQLPEQWLLFSGQARLDWQDQTIDAQGNLQADAAYWQLAPGGAPRLSDDVIVRRNAQTAPATGFRPGFNVDLTLGLGRQFHFQGAGLSSLLRGDLRLRARKNDLPRATGAITLVNGVFDAYGQKLVVESGDLSFQGLLDNPALNVRAVRKGLSVEPGVQISGSVQRPSISLVSDPELPEAEKLAWLVLGHGPENLSPSDAGVLVSAASGLLGNNGGGLVAQLKSKLGLDEIGLRQGYLGESSGRRNTSRIASTSTSGTAEAGEQIFQLGTRLSSNTVLSYEQALGTAESLVKLSIDLGRRYSLIARAGSDNALDLFYTLSFGHKAPEKSTTSKNRQQP